HTPWIIGSGRDASTGAPRQSPRIPRICWYLSRKCSRRPARLGRQLEPVIEPSEAPEHVGLGTFGKGLSAHVTGDVLGVVNFPQISRLELHPGGAHPPLSLESPERALELALRKLDQLGKAHAVLDRHAGSLGKRLQGRVRGVAKQDHP